MSDSSMAPLRSWLAAPLDQDVSEALERLRRALDVQQVAVMPDVHLAAEVCIGVVVATSHLIYPQEWEAISAAACWPSRWMWTPRH